MAKANREKRSLGKKNSVTRLITYYYATVTGRKKLKSSRTIEYMPF